MYAERLARMLEDLLPDVTIAREVSVVLLEASDGEFATIMVDGETSRIPVDAQIVVVTRALYAERYEQLSPSGSRVQVAIGELIEDKGRVRARYCFVVVAFDRDCKVIRTRFHRSMYHL
jgi:hypothetical protein